MKDHIIACKHEDTGLWHGLFYVNHPTPSGWDRPILKYSTKYGYATEQEAIEAIQVAMDDAQPYDLICLDILMPQMNGHDTLNTIRQMEAKRGIQLGEGIKVIMTTALNDSKNIMQSFNEGCEVYIVKPIARDKLLEEMEKLGLPINQISESTF